MPFLLGRLRRESYLVKPHLEDVQHAFIDNERLVIQLLDDEVVLLAVDFDDYGFDGGVAFNKDAWVNNTLVLFIEKKHHRW